MKVKWQSDAPKMELKVPSEIKIDGYIPTAQDLAFTGDCSYLFSRGHFSWILENYTSLLSFSNIENANRCFGYFESDIDLTNLTFYMKDTGQENVLEEMFARSNLQHLPHIVGKVDDCSYIFYQSPKLESIRDNFFDDFSFSKAKNPIKCHSMFNGCYNLTKVPSLKAFKQLQQLTRVPSSYYGFYYYLFSGCHNLQEIRDLPIVYGINSELKQDFFTGTFSDTYKLSSFTFEAIGQPVKWSNQTLALNGQVGYQGYFGDTWYYSVYNHDSAVETINSLPDTSAYLAEKGGTNTIKFKPDAGKKTEGGAINTMTPEEIAVAAAKGWTVVFAN